VVGIVSAIDDVVLRANLQSGWTHRPHAALVRQREMLVILKNFLGFCFRRWLCFELLGDGRLVVSALRVLVVV